MWRRDFGVATSEMWRRVFGVATFEMWRRVFGVATFLNPEGNTIFRNVGNYAANDMASHQV